jgi:hypothetical protein
MSRPSFNHTRDDGPFDPCPTCAALMTREELLTVVNDRRQNREEAAPVVTARAALVLLERLEASIPAVDPRRHNLTVEGGRLAIALAIGTEKIETTPDGVAVTEPWTRARLDESDLDRPLDDLIAELVAYVRP